jgi:hypothetical protein
MSAESEVIDVEALLRPQPVAERYFVRHTYCPGKLHDFHAGKDG